MSLLPTSQSLDLPLKTEANGFLAKERRLKTRDAATVLRLLGVVVCAAFLVRTLCEWRPSMTIKTHAVPPSDAFDWESITPSKHLNWTPCYDESAQCARLLVPLDYHDQKLGDAAIAMLRYPSSIPQDEDGYRGPILFNPGGPGISGIRFMMERGKQYRTILGEGYDLVGFDPRGIGFTTPTLVVLQNKGEEGLFTSGFLTTNNASDSALGAMHATAQHLGHLAAARMGVAAQYVGAPVVARDMLSITKAHGRDKLQYWGFSYGSVIGATFAAMFPNNVGRVVIDGVVDSHDYYQTLWSHNLLDTDATLQHVLQACVDAGPHDCPIHEDSADQIHGRIHKLLTNLRTDPASFYNNATGAYGIVDYATAFRAVFTMLYRPHEFAKPILSALADLEHGNAEPLFDLTEAKEAQDLITNGRCAPHQEAWRDGRRENQFAIACGDGPPVPRGLDELREYYEELSRSSAFAEAWSWRTGCSGWKVQAKERFSGTFPPQNDRVASFKTKTSHPILLVANTPDPVTPIRGAHKMSEGFKDSVVLTQASAGHMSFSATSVCTAKVVRAYFQNGTLPEEGTVCGTESSIFGDGVSAAGLVGEGLALLRASYELQQKSYVPFL
ncbi:hypothetical protein EIP91_009369 [Steccherinum ochraceum]|uniref:Peptidase S33 tripeptidyl aminopeptidase-like C-terminal domain-containing protein n=1 Tax=Steccherinum ochraceum TaxID=92696 RepID=A0A4R0RB71_9APHY|nr:hypothetical protein EIP91_009369 [Steccherinum ochraceum]